MLLQFSHNRQPFSLDELTQNLFKLLPNDHSHSEFSVDQISADPELLLYRRIEHLFDCDGDSVWYKGTVLAYDKDTEEFRVAYDNDDEVFCFPLLLDLEKGDLRLC